MGGGNTNRHNLFENLISLDNLFAAWKEFKSGKEQRLDIQEFSLYLEDHLFDLHRQLKNNLYAHQAYQSFYINDPKRRHIHKATVRDRIIHQALIRIIEPIFEKTFIFDSYSSRKNKGTHKAVKRLEKFAWKLSSNNTKTVWYLKCDIAKFFDTIDHQILLALISNQIKDIKLLEMIKNIIGSFKSKPGKGIPLGNTTSQIFANIYLDSLDQFIKRKLRVQYYLRYNDDFIMLLAEADYKVLSDISLNITTFLKDKLDLKLHANKVITGKWHQGIDFLGYISFPHHTILRTKTKRRIIKKIRLNDVKFKEDLMPKKTFDQSVQSYLGILQHCRGYKIAKTIQDLYL